MTRAKKPAEPVRLCRDCRWAERINQPAPFGATWDQWRKIFGIDSDWTPPGTWVCFHKSAENKFARPDLVTGEPLPPWRTHDSCEHSRKDPQPELDGIPRNRLPPLCGSEGHFWEPR